MNVQEARKFALGLMEIAEAAYLTTVDSDGFPQTRAMLNLRNKQQHPALVSLFVPHQNDLLVYLTTNTSSPKIEQIKANPAVSVYFCNPTKFNGLMLGGEIEVVTDPRLKGDIWQDGWECYYPDGPDDPDYAILRLAPKVAKGWHGEGAFGFNLGE